MGLLDSLGITGGGDEKQSQTSSVDIPEWMRPYVEPLYKQSARIGGRIANQKYKPYQGNRVSAVTPGQQRMVSGIYQNLNNPLVNKATNYTSNVIGGKFMQGNPYLEGMLDQGKKGITDSFNKTMRPQMDANIARQNAFGGSGWAQANRDMNSDLASQLSDMETQMRYQNYATEMGRRDNAVNDARGLSTDRLANMKDAISGSNLFRDVEQKQYDVDYGDFEEQRDWLFRALQGLQGGLGNAQGTYGRTQTGNIQGGDNLLGNILGAAGAVAGMGGKDGFGWWGE
jgi:hypothetical protein